MAVKATIEVPPKLRPILSKPLGSVRYRGAYGGRGSGKSFSFAKMAAVMGYTRTMRILCTRELQVSIKDSFHTEVKRAIASEPWLQAAYIVGENYIRGRHNGTEFLFKGLRHNISSIKSMSNLDLCIVEEAEDVPESSWIELIPTIRAPKSEIWVIWNPRTDGSPVDIRFRKHADADMAFVELSYRDNPWFPDVLETERQRDMRNCDPGIYAHIWDGAYLEISDAQVFNGKWKIEDFEPAADWDGPYFGADWGFSSDPTVLVKSWIGGKNLYIEREAGGVGVELDDIPEMFRSIPGSDRYVIRADSARPETISHLRRQGFSKLIPAEKWPGSVEDGIAFMRSFERIIVHPRCRETINEFRMYSYKRDRYTNDPMPDIIDAHNHRIDALRYSLQPAIKGWRNRRHAVSGHRVFGQQAPPQRVFS